MSLSGSGSLCALLLLLFAASAPAGVQAQVFAPELRTQGLGPDLQVQGGVGVGLHHKLDNNFLGRVRLGGLYAYEPWIVNAGATLEIGGLAGVGFGGELEVNSFGGPYAQLAFARVDHDAWLTHLGVGFMVFGVEWQHRFAKPTSDDALLVDVRLPLGIWWFLTHHDDKPKKAAPHASSSMFGPQVQVEAAPPPPGPSDDDRYAAEKDLERAREETKKGNYALAAEALSHAYQLEADPMLLLLLADAELAQNAWVATTHDLKRFLDATRNTDTPELRKKKAETQAKLDALGPRIPQLRVSWASAPPSELRVEVDGQAALGVLLGYDVPLDPGAHELVVTRGDEVLVQRRFSAAEGQVVRLALDANVRDVAPDATPPAAGSEPNHE